SDAPVSLEMLEAVLPRFRGEILQIPPMYSAVSVNGQRLYDLARRGIEVEREPRPITVHELTLLSYDPENRAGTAFVRCSKGTYIRTVCHDIGEALGVGGVMTALRRAEAAGFTLGDCITLEEAQRLADEGRLFERILPVERMFLDLPECPLNEIQTRMFLNGVRLDLGRLIRKDLSGRVRVYGSDGTFLGLADADRETMELKLKKFFIDRS
ncbi:MAG: tRNA pseudouridine(55) synthase TruB, partial [Oscillospiraceae bacterium]|nr:tRNA pseudouridine(55) synthase TruB [Oscillospiraceae bacterium]